MIKNIELFALPLINFFPIIPNSCEIADIRLIFYYLITVFFYFNFPFLVHAKAFFYALKLDSSIKIINH